MRLLAYSIILIIAVWLGLQLAADPGYALFAYKYWTVEMPLWLFIILFIILLLIIYAGLRLLHAGGALRHYFQGLRRQRRIDRTRKQLSRGFIELTEGHWHKAEQCLIKSAKYSDLPVINYLAAARAVHELGNYQRRDEYLRLAHQATDQAEIAVSLTQAQLQLSHQQFEQALATLNHLRQLMPQHTYVLRLLKRLYIELKEWKELENLIPDLRKNKVFNKNEISQLEQLAFHSQLTTAANDNELLQQIWQRMPRNLKQDPLLTAAYVKPLIATQQHDTAAEIIKEVLHHHWNDQLIYLYGTAITAHPDHQLKIVEAWLKQQGKDPTLLLTAGRLANACQLWGKARDYFAASLSLQPRAETYRELGQLLEQLSEKDAAFDCYRQGLQLA